MNKVQHPIDATIDYVVNHYQHGIFAFDLADVLQEQYARVYSSDYPHSAYMECWNRLNKLGFRVIGNE